MSSTLGSARALLGADVLGPEEVAAAFGVRATGAGNAPIPFSRDGLVAARERGEMLVLRQAQLGDGTPLTIVRMIEHCPQAFDARLLRKVGYQLKDEWGIELEPLAATETCRAGWAVVRKDILPDSHNLDYDGQEVALQRYAETAGGARDAVRRRSAVEAVYDTVLYFAARQVRLLEKSWDWSGSRTVDGGYLNVGGFGSAGMQIIGFSAAVRHGALGVCPTHQPIG